MKIRNRIKELRNVLASSLKANPKNWRTHPQAQSEAMRGILAEIGYADSLIARELPDGSLMLIDGHLRAETTPDEMVPVQIVDLTEAEADKLLLSLDPLAAMAESNAAAMQQLCDDADTNNAALQAMWDEMQANVEQPAVAIVEDEVPEPPVDPITKAGDLWILGEHRVLCGDSTNTDDVARLMAGAVVDSVITDPPYGIDFNTDYRRFTSGLNVSRTNHARVANDDKPFDPSRFIEFEHAVLFGANCFSNRLPLGTWLIWDKRFKNGTAMLSDAECAWMKGGHGVYIFAETSQGFVRPEAIEHPTQKPVSVMAWCIEKCKGGPIIYDPFLGSGTTLIAAQQVNRKCYGMEISPAYCDVIVKRWENLTGKKATLEMTNGKTRPEKTAYSSAIAAGKSGQAKDKRSRAKA